MDTLEGKAVGVLRASGQSEGITDRLRSAGATPLVYPVIAVVPPESFEQLDATLSPSSSYDWVVFTSANAAEAVASRLRTGHCALPAGARLAAIGAATEAAVRAFGEQGIFVSPRSDSAGLAEWLPIASGSRVLVPASSLAGPELRDRLVAKGASVDMVTAYRTVPDQGGIAALDQRLARTGLDALLVTSGSTVRFLMGELPARARAALMDSALRPRLVSIGPATTAVAGELGMTVDATATSPTPDGMLDALRSCFDHAA